MFKSQVNNHGLSAFYGPLLIKIPEPREEGSCSGNPAPQRAERGSEEWGDAGTK